MFFVVKNQGYGVFC